jgi:hypothetical protein
MSFLPGWDSIQLTETIGHNLHITAVVVLGFLFLSEGMALIYDSRNHSLARVAAQNAEIQRKSDADTAETRRKTEVEGLQYQLTEADSKVKALQSQNTARRLSEADKTALIKDLSNSPGQKAKIICITSGWDCSDYAKDFLYVFERAKWVLPDPPIQYAMVTGRDVAGVEVLINSRAVAEPQKVPGDFADSINYLARFLTKIRQMPTETVLHAPDIEYGSLVLQIGRIPPLK